MLVDVAECRALPAAEGVIGDRNRDRYVDADHADVDALGELAGGVAVAREDGDAIAVLMLGRETQRVVEGFGANHLQNWAENLFVVALHLRSHPVEQGRADEKAFLMALQREAAAVD